MMGIGMYHDRPIWGYVVAIVVLLVLAAFGSYADPNSAVAVSFGGIVKFILVMFLFIVTIVVIRYRKEINLKQLLCREHEFIQTSPPRPYGYGVDNPFMSENIGWGRAWVIPIKCKKCGWEHNAHRSSPSMLQRHVNFYWSATESNIKLAKQITEKLNAMVPSQLEQALHNINEIILNCSECGFKTQNADDYRTHIINEHLAILRKDVLDTYLIKHDDVEIQYF